MLLRLLLSVPVLPFGNSAGRGILVNRRNMSSRWISQNDIRLNVSDWLYTFANRTPSQGFIRRDENNGYRGASYPIDRRGNEYRRRGSVNPFA